MDIEEIYKKALSSGNHASALKAVYEAGRFHVEQVLDPVFVDGPTAVAYSISLHTLDITGHKDDDSHL